MLIRDRVHPVLDLLGTHSRLPLSADQVYVLKRTALRGVVDGVAAVVEEQSAATDGVSASAEEMHSQVDHTGMQARERAAAADQLRELVARFKLTDEAPAARLSTLPSQRLRAA